MNTSVMRGSSHPGIIQEADKPQSGTSSSPQILLELSHLSKSYGKHQAVKDLSFSIRKGELFALLGVNGAGKSTTISMITRILTPDQGEISFQGMPVHSSAGKQRGSGIGIVFQESVLDEELSLLENLKLRGSLYDLSGSALKKKLNQLDAQLELSAFWKQKVRTLSGGQRRKGDVARALISSPELLILDEPTTGLDPATRKRLWQTIEDLGREMRMTVLLTTHYMEEAAKADYAVILDEGQIKAKGSVSQLKNQYAKDMLVIYGDEARLSSIQKSFPKSRKEHRRCTIELENCSEVRDLMQRHSDWFEDFELIKGSMDDVFLNVTGRNSTDE